MTLIATKFTPEVLLSAPRRSAGAPNPTGKKVLFTVSAYSFHDHKRTSQIKVLDIKSGQSTLLYADSSYSEPTWVGEKHFLLIKRGDQGTSSLLVGDASQPGKEPVKIYEARGSISNLKVKRVSESEVLVACSALSTPEGKMYNAEDEEKVYHTGKVYSSLFVRHWDSYVTKNSNSIWYGILKWRSSTPAPATAEPGSQVLMLPGLTNLLAGTGLQSPVPPFGGAGDFDICSRGIAFVARDPDVNPATHTKSSVYLVPLESFERPRNAPPKPIPTPGLEGYSASPTFSPDETRLVFTRMRDQQYESDKPRLLLSSDVWADDVSTREFFATEDGEGGWDARPESPIWSADGKEIYCVAENKGNGTLFRLPSDPKVAAAVLGDGSPEACFKEGTVLDVRLLQDGSSRLFISASSLTDSSHYSIVDPRGSDDGAGAITNLVSSMSKQGKTFGLSRSQVGDIWFKGAGNYQVHALVVRPSTFDENRRYPLALLIHGGPQAAWNDAWSTRWNPAIFAEQGYVVVCPNPTGSTGYGMALQNGIQNEWGGRPYNDIVNCFEYVSDNMPYVDTGRAVALGASYGGYMINWIQGNSLGRRFKALVCHDGVFSTLSQYSSEIIHNSLDYRLCESEGIAAFNVLQSKGVPSRFLTFPDENHWVLKPENSLLWHAEVLAWINKYSGVEDDEDAMAPAPFQWGNGKEVGACAGRGKPQQRMGSAK